MRGPDKRVHGEDTQRGQTKGHCGADGPRRGEASVSGCSAATVWLALVMACWGGRVSAVAFGGGARSYVDDLVAHGRKWGPSAVADVLEVTELFGGAFGLVLNASKSIRVPSSAEVRAELRLMPGPPVGVAFKDLGLDQDFVGLPPLMRLSGFASASGAFSGWRGWPSLGKCAVEWCMLLGSL